MHFDFTLDTIGLVVGLNVLLTFVHYILGTIHERYKWQWSDRALQVVSFLMSMISIMMGNIAHRRPTPEIKS